METSRLLDETWALVSEGKQEQAREKLVEAAQIDPLNERVHELADAVVEMHPFMICPPRVAFASGFQGVAQYLEGVGDHPGLLLYALPQVGRLDPALLAVFEFDEGKATEGGEGRGRVALGPDIHPPLHEPRCDGRYGFTWHEPSIRYQEPVLHIQQRSTYFEEGMDEKSVEREYFTAYRIRGHLFHVRMSLWHMGG